MGRRHSKNNKRKKKSKPDHDPFPTDVLIEILERLPVKSLARFTCVSKSWAAIIRSKEFIRSFSIRSSLSHRFLLVYNKNDYHPNNVLHHWCFCPSDFTFQTKFQILNREYKDIDQDYVHGLVSYLCGQCQIIINPSNGKFITLPSVKTRRVVVKRFFGYDPVEDQYKVLCIVKANYGSGTRIAPNEDQVLTLESSSSSSPQWRKLEGTSVPHSPICSGICIDGVVYYFAYVGENVLTLVKFEVKSEELKFVTTRLLEYLPQPSYNLIPYGRNVAMVNRTGWGTFDLCVLKDAVKDEWLKICLSTRPGSNMIWTHPFCVLGTAHTGEVILAHVDRYGSLNITYHDHQKKTQRQVAIQGNGNFDLSQYSLSGYFIDYIESVMFL